MEELGLLIASFTLPLMLGGLLLIFRESEIRAMIEGDDNQAFKTYRTLPPIALREKHSINRWPLFHYIPFIHSHRITINRLGGPLTSIREATLTTIAPNRNYSQRLGSDPFHLLLQPEIDRSRIVNSCFPRTSLSTDYQTVACP